MSVWFISSNGQDLWNPSSGAAEFFIRGVRALEAYLERESGIGDIVADEVVVNSTLLTDFLETAVQVMTHPVARFQADALLTVCYVLLDRSDAQRERLHRISASLPDTGDLAAKMAR